MEPKISSAESLLPSDSLLRQPASKCLDALTEDELELWLTFVNSGNTDLDEVVQLEEHIKALYPVPKGTGLVVDSTAVLRAALLERGSFESVRLNVSLAISSLSAASVGRSNSSRMIWPIVLQAGLKADQIVREIWMKGISSIRSSLILSDKEMYRLHLVANTVNQLPRLVQMVDIFLRNRLHNYKGDEPEFIDQACMTSLFASLSDMVEKAYDELTVPPDDILRAIVLDEPIPYQVRGLNQTKGNLGLQDAITSSIITNSITSFKESGRLVGIQTCIAMLVLATKKLSSQSALSDTIHDGLCAIISSLSSANPLDAEGGVVEILCYEWLRIRFVAGFFLPPSGGMSILQLLGLHARIDFIVPKNLLWLTKARLIEQQQIGTVELTLLLRKDAIGFLRELDEILVDETSPEVLIKPAKGEAWD
eukprot:gene2037-2424_t